MAAATFTEEECEALYAAPKYMASELAWKPGLVQDVFLFKAQVITKDGGAVLELTGHWQKKGRHNRTTWGFSLNFMGHPVRHYDMGKKHRNPGGGGNVTGPHKHKYKSSKIPRFAYKPDPPISEDNPNQALIDFLHESNIDIPDNYQFFMFP